MTPERFVPGSFATAKIALPGVKSWSVRNRTCDHSASPVTVLSHHSEAICLCETQHVSCRHGKCNTRLGESTARLPFFQQKFGSVDYVARQRGCSSARATRKRLKTPSQTTIGMLLMRRIIRGSEGASVILVGSYSRA